MTPEEIKHSPDPLVQGFINGVPEHEEGWEE